MGRIRRHVSNPPSQNCLQCTLPFVPWPLPCSEASLPPIWDFETTSLVVPPPPALPCRPPITNRDGHRTGPVTSYLDSSGREPQSRLSDCGSPFPWRGWPPGLCSGRTACPACHSPLALLPLHTLASLPGIAPSSSIGF